MSGFLDRNPKTGRFVARDANRPIGELLAERLLPNIKKTDSCWLWTGCKSWHGYGVIAINKQKFLAHRLSYRMHFGEFDETMQVCHTCDVPLCVNPEHLFIGTHLDNMQDMCRKSRNVFGNRHPQSILTPFKVNQIRKHYKYHSRKFGTNAFSRKYGVSPQTIWVALKGRTWKQCQ